MDEFNRLTHSTFREIIRLYSGSYKTIMNVPAAANTLGTLGAVCWSIQLLPQILINYRRHHTTGLQPLMMLLWASAGVPLGVYNIVERFNIALRIQAQILTLLSLITCVQCYYYGKRWSVGRCFGAVAVIGGLMGGVEATLIVLLRIAALRQVRWPITFMAVLAAVLLAAGVLRHYWDTWTPRTVRGISFIFVSIDAAGDLFSLLSICVSILIQFLHVIVLMSVVVFQAELSVLGMAIYGTELTLWIGVFVCGGYLNLVPWAQAKISTRRQQRENEALEHTQQNAANGTNLHRMPSSSSVFQTPSSGLVERNVSR